MSQLEAFYLLILPGCSPGEKGPVMPAITLESLGHLSHADITLVSASVVASLSLLRSDLPAFVL